MIWRQPIPRILQINKEGSFWTFNGGTDETMIDCSAFLEDLWVLPRIPVPAALEKIALNDKVSLLLVVVVSVASLALLGYMLQVLSNELPKNVMWPIGLGSFLVLYVYLSRMFKYGQERRLKRAGVLFACMVLTFAVPFSAFEVMMPKWSFAVVTDKTAYKLGETVVISMCLTNNGRITHSFNKTNGEIRAAIYLSNSSISLRWIGITIVIDRSEYSVAAGQVVRRTVVWNQTVFEGGSGQFLRLSTGLYYLRIEVCDMSNISVPLFKDYLQVMIEP